MELLITVADREAGKRLLFPNSDEQLQRPRSGWYRAILRTRVGETHERGGGCLPNTSNKAAVERGNSRNDRGKHPIRFVRASDREREENDEKDYGASARRGRQRYRASSGDRQVREEEMRKSVLVYISGQRSAEKPMTQTITIGSGAEARVLVIPGGWDAFVIDGRRYVRAADWSFACVRRVAKVGSPSSLSAPCSLSCWPSYHG